MRKMKLTPSLLLVLVLVLAMTIGTTYAKYVSQETVNGTVNITAELGEIQMVCSNNESYSLIPGHDIVVGDYVQINNKSPIPAYVFLTLKTNINTDNKDATDDTNLADDHNVSYTLSNNWRQISSATVGEETTIVYVYAADGSTATVVDNTFGENGTGQIPVNAMIEVSQKLNVPGTGVYLSFTAHMYQTASGATAADIYQENTNP